MKPDKKADDLLREKLNSYSSPVPAGLFDAIDKKREEQQAATAFGWRVKAGISAMVLLLVVGVVYWQTNSYTTSKVEASTIDNKEQITANTLKENSPFQKTIQIQTKIAEQDNSNFQIKSTKEKAFIDNTQHQTKRSHSSVSIPTRVVPTTANKSDVIKQTSSIKTPTENAKIDLNIRDTDNPSIETPVLPSDNIPLDTPSEADIAEQKMAGQSVLVNPLENKGLLVDDKYHAAMPKIKCGWEARKVYLYFDAITSIDMAFRTLSPQLNDGESEAYAILRNQTEGMRESSSLGFRASAVTKGGFAMRTGLIYSTIKEPFSQRIYTEYEEYIETRNEAGEILSLDTIIITEIQKFEFSNRYKLLDVPVILGYEIDKDKYNIGFNGGAYINITATQEGRFVTPNNEIVDFSTNSPNRYEVFKANVGISLYSSIAVNYKITPSLHFIFEPYGRYYMNSFTTDAHELNQNYFVAGMQVGLRMKM
ncbi:MAG: hypothetical protein ACI85O_001847 [Saprospiraceae bacterium]|jgi:hypothetical protein